MIMQLDQKKKRITLLLLKIMFKQSLCLMSMDFKKILYLLAHYLLVYVKASTRLHLQLIAPLPGIHPAVDYGVVHGIAHRQPVNA